MTVTPTPRPITEVAASLGIARENLVPYGDDKAKLNSAMMEIYKKEPLSLPRASLQKLSEDSRLLIRETIRM